MMYKGNCIDKFIEKKIDKLFNNLLYIRYSILKRIDERDNQVDYFNTGCYEKDFSDIRKIKEEANNIVKECNKFLERISEQYSKLN